MVQCDGAAAQGPHAPDRVEYHESYRPIDKQGNPLLVTADTDTEGHSWWNAIPPVFSSAKEKLRGLSRLHVSLDAVGDTRILGRHHHDFRSRATERGKAIVDEEEEELLTNGRLGVQDDGASAGQPWEDHNGGRATVTARWTARLVSGYRRWSRWWLSHSRRWRTATCRTCAAIVGASIVTLLAPIIWRYKRDEVIAAAWCVFTIFIFATLYAPLCREPTLPRRLQRDWVG